MLSDKHNYADLRQNQQSGMRDQQRLIRPVWSESSLCTQWVAKDPSFLHVDSENSDQAGWMPRLIWVFAGRTGHFVGFVMRQLIFIHHSNYSILHNESEQILTVLCYLLH